MVIIVSGPDTCRVIGGVAHKPHIPVIRSRTGLSGDAHTAEIHGFTGTLGDYVRMALSEAMPVLSLSTVLL